MKNFKDSRKKYSSMYLSTCFLHILFGLIAYKNDFDFFLYYNIFIVFLYVILSYMAMKVDNLRVCFFICFFEILIFSVFGTILMGYGSGFSLYLLCIVPLSAYLTYKMGDDKKKLMHVFYILISSYIVSTFVSVFDILPSYNIDIFYHKLIFIINSFVGIILLISFLVVFLSEISKKENKLTESNKILKEEANYDKLTGLLNRRTLEEKFNKRVNQYIRDNKKFCLVIFDIDDFKKVNDTYGHDCGDEVLKMVADTLRESLRKTDIIFRWGGEEIVVLISNDKNKAFEIAERCRLNISNKYVLNKNKKIKVTVTGGLCSYSKKYDLNKTIINADEALYYGKNNGKNQIVVYKK